MSLDWAAEISPALFLVVAVIAMSTVVPKTAVSIVCGSLYSVPVGCAMITAIATTAAAINYSIGHRVYRIPHRPGTRWHAVAQTLRHADMAGHLLVRLSPVPTMVISYLCGSLCCRRRPYLVAAAAASVPQWLWVAAAGAGVAASREGTTLRYVTAAVAVTAAIVAAVWIGRTAASRLP